MILLILCEGGPAAYINKLFQKYICYLSILLEVCIFLIQSENKLEKTAEKHKCVGSPVQMYVPL